MKIGILTFHRVFNPGAFLQALGTQDLLLDLGHDAVIVNYAPKAQRFSVKRYLWKFKWRIIFNLRNLFDCILKNRAFEADRIRYMRMTEEVFSYEELSKLEIDAFVVGADIVWNFELDHLGHDPVYFGHHLSKGKLISFSASVGQCDVDAKLPEYVISGLNKFSAISVRDPNTQRMVERVLGFSPPVLCDPAFHLNEDKFASKADCKTKKPFILIYMIPRFCKIEFIQAVKAFAQDKGMSVVATLYRNDWADENQINHGPIEWLQLIDDASYVITNTFHGTVFSIMKEKQFALQYTPLIESKTSTMIEELGLGGRVVKDAKALGTILDSEWDKSSVSVSLNKWRADSRQFLQESI